MEKGKPHKRHRETPKPLDKRKEGIKKEKTFSPRSGLRNRAQPQKFPFPKALDPSEQFSPQHADILHFVLDGPNALLGEGHRV